MSDDEGTGFGHRMRNVAGSMRSAVAESFAPGVLVRLKYASYLFFALLTCLVLKGTVGHVMSGVPYLREGCVYSEQAAAGGGAAHEHYNAISAAAADYASHLCYGNTFVYRVSFSLFVFFLFMFISVSDLTCCIDDRSRAQLQGGLFCLKSAFLTLLNIAALWIPNSFFASYAWVAMVVSGIFLVVQVMLIVDFSYILNEEWGERSDDNSKWQWYLGAVALLSYGAGIAMTVMSFIYFTPSSSCNTHGFILVFNIVGAVVVTAVSVWVPHGSVVPSGIVFAYTSFLLLTAFRLDPDETCNTIAPDVKNGVGSMKMTLISAFVSSVALAYTVVSSSGADSAASLTLGDAEEGAANADADASETGGLVRRRFDTAVGHLPAYCFFYLIMMAGSMYLAMLATDWTISGDSEGGAPPGPHGGHTGTVMAMWVKVATSWLTLAMYLWSLLAPYFCCKDRDFGYDTSDW